MPCSSALVIPRAFQSNGRRYADGDVMNGPGGIFTFREPVSRYCRTGVFPTPSAMKRTQLYTGCRARAPSTPPAPDRDGCAGPPVSNLCHGSFHGCQGTPPLTRVSASAVLTRSTRPMLHRHPAAFTPALAHRHRAPRRSQPSDAERLRYQPARTSQNPSHHREDRPPQPDLPGLLGDRIQRHALQHFGHPTLLSMLYGGIRDRPTFVNPHAATPTATSGLMSSAGDRRSHAHASASNRVTEDRIARFSDDCPISASCPAC